MAIYTITYEVEAEEEHEALEFVRRHYDEPTRIEVEEDEEDDNKEGPVPCVCGHPDRDEAHVISTETWETCEGEVIV